MLCCAGGEFEIINPHTGDQNDLPFSGTFWKVKSSPYGYLCMWLDWGGEYCIPDNESNLIESGEALCFVRDIGLVEDGRPLDECTMVVQMVGPTDTDPDQPGVQSDQTIQKGQWWNPAHWCCDCLAANITDADHCDWYYFWRDELTWCGCPPGPGPDGQMGTADDDPHGEDHSCWYKDPDGLPDEVCGCSCEGENDYTFVDAPDGHAQAGHFCHNSTAVQLNAFLHENCQDQDEICDKANYADVWICHPAALGFDSCCCRYYFDDNCSDNPVTGALTCRTLVDEEFRKTQAELFSEFACDAVLVEGLPSSDPIGGAFMCKKPEGCHMWGLNPSTSEPFGAHPPWDAVPDDQWNCTSCFGTWWLHEQVPEAFDFDDFGPGECF